MTPLLPATHVGTQHLGDLHAAISLLIVLVAATRLRSFNIRVAHHKDFPEFVSLHRNNQLGRMISISPI